MLELFNTTGMGHNSAVGHRGIRSLSLSETTTDRQQWYHFPKYVYTNFCMDGQGLHRPWMTIHQSGTTFFSGSILVSAWMAKAHINLDQACIKVVPLSLQRPILVSVGWPRLTSPLIEFPQSGTTPSILVSAWMAKPYINHAGSGTTQSILDSEWRAGAGQGLHKEWYHSIMTT